MAAYSLVSAAEARDLVNGGALLVCAYDSDDKFNNARLDGAISLSEFRSRLGTFASDRDIIFY